MEEARNAIRHLNGAMLTGRSMKVSFAKYDKNDMPWNGAAPQAVDQVSKSVGRESKHRKTTNDGRSFKEVVEGLHHHMKG